jgi:hypothetical protein
MPSVAEHAGEKKRKKGFKKLISEIGQARVDNQAHEAWADENKKRFKKAIISIVPDRADELSKYIELHNNYEDYIAKSRQGNHPKIQAYGQIATAVVSLLIAAVVAAISLKGFLSPSLPSLSSQADIIIKIIAASDNEHVASNLRAFRAANVIRLDDDEITKLSTAQLTTDRKMQK